MTLATVICAFACAVLVAAEYQHHTLARAIAKPIASLAFVALGTLAVVTAAAPTAVWREYQLYMVVGLVLGMIGDIALLGKTDGAFLAGLVAFLLGHVAYIVGFAQLAPVREWLDIRALIPLGAGATVLRLLWPKLGSMRGPVIAYVLAIVIMVAAAFAAARAPGVPHDNSVLLLVGAALFFVSDLAVARDKFVGASFANRAWGLPAYYAAQILMAWSLWPRLS